MVFLFIKVDMQTQDRAQSLMYKSEGEKSNQGETQTYNGLKNWWDQRGCFSQSNLSLSSFHNFIWEPELHVCQTIMSITTLIDKTLTAPQ